LGRAAGLPAALNAVTDFGKDKRLPRLDEPDSTCETMKPAVPLLAGCVLALSAGLAAEPLYYEPFDTGAGPLPSQGQYGDGMRLTDPENRGAYGGAIAGCEAAKPWEGKTSLPQTLFDLEDGGGLLEFRGASTPAERMVYRQFSNETEPLVGYFSVELKPAVADDEALMLVALTSYGGKARGEGFLEGEGFFHGFAVGFKGDGARGMDLILRYRDANLEYGDRVLREDVRGGEALRVVVRVEWDIIEPLANPWELLTVWVNPGEHAARSRSQEVFAFAGEPGMVNCIYLVQRRYGSSLADAVYLDDLRYGTSFPDESP